MTEKDLIDLGFRIINVTEEESGSMPYYFYTWDLNENQLFGLYSTENDRVVNDEWSVRIFEIDDVEFTSRQDVEQLIALLTKNKSTSAQ